MMASILVGSIEISSLDTRCPKNEIYRSKNSHLENLSYNLFSLKIVRAFRMCSWSIFKYIRMSSMNTITNVSRHSLNTRFINSMNTTGSLLRPKDITTNL